VPAKLWGTRTLGNGPPQPSNETACMPLKAYRIKLPWQTWHDPRAPDSGNLHMRMGFQKATDDILRAGYNDENVNESVRPAQQHLINEEDPPRRDSSFESTHAEYQSHELFHQPPRAIRNMVAPTRINAHLSIHLWESRESGESREENPPWE
jgi:hypothetical protein